MSLTNCFRLGMISVLRSFIGYINLCLVALSTRNKAYFVPFVAVPLPKRMSMWTTSPSDLGKGRGVVFRFGLSLVAVSPISTIGSLSSVDILKLVDVSFNSFRKLFTFLKPNPFELFCLQGGETICYQRFI